jgi:putative membrane protein
VGPHPNSASRAGFARGENTRSHRYYRVMNELPDVILFAVVILVVVKSF